MAMERASLRPVPRRPVGPVDPADAIAHVASTLPTADEPARVALALVEIAGQSRGEAAKRGGLPADQLAEALARGRKALRRSLYPLPGSGWCERAERMISDRLDGQLEPPGPARLDAHLRNCPRCVQHDLRLAQSIDSLVAGFIEAYGAPEPASPAAPPAVPAHRRPASIRAARPALHVLPFGAPVEPVPARARAAPEPPVAAVAAPDPVAAPEPVVAPDPVLPPAPLAVSAPAEPPAAPPAERTSLGATVAWRAMYAAAILLAVLAVIVTALGVAGVDLL